MSKLIIFLFFIDNFEATMNKINRLSSKKNKLVVRIQNKTPQMRRKEREIREIVEIEEVILNSDVCRMAFANNDFPYVVTMNFGYRNDNGYRIYFHCSTEGRKLEMMDKNNFVCFEFDTGHTLHEGRDACDFGMSYRSVVGWGRLSRVTAMEEREEGLLAIMEHYSGRRNFSFRPEILARTLVLRLDITEMTGKRCQ
jgi:hypothetical protein